MGVVDEEVSVDTTANATLLRHYTFVFKRPGSGELNTIALSRDPKTSSFGIELDKHRGGSLEYPPIVSSVNPGSRAEKHGVKTGDIVISVDGEDTRTITALVEIVTRVQGEDDACVASRAMTRQVAPRKSVREAGFEEFGEERVSASDMMVLSDRVAAAVEKAVRLAFEHDQEAAGGGCMGCCATKRPKHPRTGHGSHWFPSGNVYHGEYRCGEKHGHGIFKYKNGNVYMGQFFADRKEGHGVFHYASGSTYEGSFAQGVPDGKGTFRWADGTVEVANFKGGQAFGLGVAWSADGEHAFLMQDERLVEEVSLEEAAEIATSIGMAVPVSTLEIESAIAGTASMHRQVADHTQLRRDVAKLFPEKDPVPAAPSDQKKPRTRSVMAVPRRLSLMPLPAKLPEQNTYYLTGQTGNQVVSSSQWMSSREETKANGYSTEKPNSTRRQVKNKKPMNDHVTIGAVEEESTSAYTSLVSKHEGVEPAEPVRVSIADANVRMSARLSAAATAEAPAEAEPVAADGGKKAADITC